MNNPLAVGWDLDSAPASTLNRRHLIPDIKAGKATWDQYSDLCPDDEPIAGAVALARMLHAAGHPQVAISGRSERAWDRRWHWLARYGVPMDHLILRPEGDCTDNKLFKVQKINELRDWGLEFCLFIEGWAPVAAYITEQTGIPVLGVNPFDEGSTLVTRDQLVVVVDELNSFGFQPGDGPEVADAIFSRLGGVF